MITKVCPYCGGSLEGAPVGRLPLIPATAPGDYIWQCRGSCRMFIFNHPLEGIDAHLERLSNERKGKQ